MQYAEVAELADAQASGACGSNTVWVQVPSSALETRKASRMGCFFVSNAEKTLFIKDKFGKMRVLWEKQYLQNCIRCVRKT